MEVEIGIGKSGRRAYGFDDIAIVPSRRTRDPEDVDITWEVDAYKFELPMMAAAMDGVVSPSTAIEIRSSLARVPGVVVAAAEPEAGAPAVPSSPSPASSGASSRSWSRAYAVAIAAAFVVAVVGVVAAVGLSGHGKAPAAASKSHQDRAVKPRSVASTPTSAAPSTTARARVVPVAPVVARSNNGATVSVHSPFRLTLRASGTCWVEITDATGHTLFTATLHSGQQQQIPGAGPIVVRIGYTPAMTISVDGTDIELGGLGQTTNLTFQTA